MRQVIPSLLLAAMLGAQVPLPPVPGLPTPPDPVQQSMPAPMNLGPQPAIDNAPPLTPSVMPSSFRQDLSMPLDGEQGTKPPPFRLLDSGMPPDTAGIRPGLMPGIESLPAGSVAAPCLVLMRTGPTSVKAGEPFAYEIVARNAGTVAATRAKLEEELPPGTRFISAQPMPSTQDEHLIWTIDNLAPGAERRFKVEVEANRNGEWTANATLTIAVSSSARASVTGAVQQPLVITGPPTLPVGHPVAFQMHIANQTASTLTDAMLRVQMSPGLQHIQGDAIEAALGDLAPGQSKDLTLDVISVQTGKLTADATLLSGKKTIAAAQAGIVVTEQPTLAIRQTGPLSPPVGGEHEFKIEVVNRSGAEVREVEVIDELPEGLTFAAGDARAHYEAATKTLRWTIGTLAAGQSRQMVFRAKVRGTTPQVNKITARASGIADAQLHSVIRPGGGR